MMIYSKQSLIWSLYNTKAQWGIMGRIAGDIGRHGRIMCDYERFAAYTLLEAIQQL